ncbi:aldo/keto reductase [Niveibacterium sp. SC-1]|uniref:aldo/keto reductase n=1 Tax=Niveibacterium sp. SC-1 TaxID=3135646 RepID=UPI00311FBA9E
MEYRKLGKTGFEVSAISLGTWQVGGRWGEPFNDQTAEAIIEAAIERGVNFIDTADVYSDRASEAAVGRVVRRVKSRHGERVRVATKCGRFINPHVNEGYTVEALRGYVETSLKNSGLEALDLIQLHCPPTQVYYRPEIFELFDTLKAEGKILNLGVSVEKVEEAIKAIEFPNVTSVQIIFNMFRMRPAERFFAEAKARDVGIVVRVPLASGLLTGTYSKSTAFGEGDHRTFNRQGAAFDKGETFSGVDYEQGLAAVEELKKLFPGEPGLAAWALRWVLMFPEVSTVIPGASRVQQLEANIAASELRALTAAEMEGAKAIYTRYIKPSVHQLW